MTSKGNVILVRGIPGSGKTHHVEELRKQYELAGDVVSDFVMCSADKFFMKAFAVVKNGVATSEIRMEYIYDQARVAQAHVYCMSEFIDALNSGVRVIVVDNTFIHQWEMKNYIKLANYAEYDVDFHEIRVVTVAELTACTARNVHRIPAEAIARMATAFEPMDERMKNVLVIPFGGQR